MPTSLPGTPIAFSPKGVSDTLDSSTAFPGAMQSLINMIPDPTSRALWQCRPAATVLVNLAAVAFPTATAFTALLQVGNRIYGMVTTTRLGVRDEPFCYDVQRQVFVPITGTTAVNTPVTPSPGPWSPPSMALVGAKIIVSHPGFSGAANAFFGVIDTVKQNALTWTATNTAPVALVFPPTWVVNFNGRCYFLVNPPGSQPGAYFSDVLLATSITNANQILTFGDNVTLTVAAGLALQNQLGGIIQALMIFKGVANIFQVTGDFALGNLSVNSLNVATGTNAPNSVVSSEKGLIFMAPDGVRLIDFTATVSDPIGKDGDGVTVPFIFASNPSRTNAVFNAGVYRIQVMNAAAGNVQQEWWYDFVRDCWSGPHTTGQLLGVPFQNTFIIAIIGGGAKLFQSDQVQSPTSSFSENGNALKYTWQTSMLPDTDQMAECAMVETTLHAAIVPTVTSSPWSAGWSMGFGPLTDQGSVAVAAIDQRGVAYDTVLLKSPNAGSLWGSFLWGIGLWGGTVSPLYPRRLSWHFPIVFRRMAIVANGTSAAGIKIGRLHLRYQVLNYLQMDFGVV